MVDPVMIGRNEREQRSRPLLRRMIGEVLRRTRLEQGRTLAGVSRVAKVSVPYLLAGVGRDLAGDRARGAGIARLEAVRDRRASSPVRGSGDVVCLLAA
jgi:hypothetical protein